MCVFSTSHNATVSIPTAVTFINVNTINMSSPVHSTFFTHSLHLPCLSLNHAASLHSSALLFYVTCVPSPKHMIQILSCDHPNHIHHPCCHPLYLTPLPSLLHFSSLSCHSCSCYPHLHYYSLSHYYHHHTASIFIVTFISPYHHHP